MKKLDLHHHAFKAYLAEFKRYLVTVNYAPSTQEGAPRMLKEYLFYLQEASLELGSIRNLDFYFTYLYGRKNEKTDGGLSVTYLQKHSSSLKLFYDFLLKTEQIQPPIFPQLKRVKSTPSVLTKKEIKALFDACGESMLGKRNRAVLALFYGLGLRKSEGANLALEDVDLNKEEVFIKKSKTHRQRRVPMPNHVKEILEDYIFNVREKLVPKDKSTSSLLVTEIGKPLSGSSVVYIIKKLLREAKIKTPASLHTLRHSIATHLLQNGMKLESIALFLGHRSLDSTQIYTHLSAEQANLKQENYENIQ